MVVVHAMDFAVGRAQAVADRTIVCSLGSPRAGCFYLNWRASRAGCKLQARRGNCESYVDCPKGRMAGKARCCPSSWLFLMGSSWILHLGVSLFFLVLLLSWYVGVCGCVGGS